KPHIQKLAAPALRVQLVNAVAELARVSDPDIQRLLELPQAKRFDRPAPARRSWDAPRSPEWSLLACLLTDLGMVEHVDPVLLTPDLPETRALLAIREFCEACAEEPMFAVLIEGLQGNPCLDLVLSAQRYGDEVGFDEEGARGEFQNALGKLDLARRRKELDELRGRGQMSKEDLLVFNEKVKAYKRLQGALPSP
ncbi:MAG: hypothetical protein ACREBP_07950, partial [Sphingomicrobium sp.]